MEEEVGSTDTRRTTYIATRRHVPRRIRVWVYHDRMSRARTASHGSPVYRLEKNRREGEKTDRGRTLRAAAENWATDSLLLACAGRWWWWIEGRYPRRRSCDNIFVVPALRLTVECRSRRRDVGNQPSSGRHWGALPMLYSAGYGRT